MENDIVNNLKNELVYTENFDPLRNINFQIADLTISIPISRYIYTYYQAIELASDIYDLPNFLNAIYSYIHDTKKYYYKENIVNIVNQSLTIYKDNISFQKKSLKYVKPEFCNEISNYLLARNEKYVIFSIDVQMEESAHSNILIVNQTDTEVNLIIFEPAGIDIIEEVNTFLNNIKICIERQKNKTVKIIEGNHVDIQSLIESNKILNKELTLGFCLMISYLWLYLFFLFIYDLNIENIENLSYGMESYFQDLTPINRIKSICKFAINVIEYFIIKNKNLDSLHSLPDYDKTIQLQAVANKIRNNEKLKPASLYFSPANTSYIDILKYNFAFLYTLKVSYRDMVFISKTDKCIEDIDCEKNNFCKDGKCTPYECQEDEDCKEGYCVDNICKSVKKTKSS